MSEQVDAKAARAWEGKPVKEADELKRQAVREALADPQLRKWSNQKIADRCGVSIFLAKKVRDQEEAAGNIPETPVRTYQTKDGKTVSAPVNNNRKPKPAGRGRPRPATVPAKAGLPLVDAETVDLICRLAQKFKEAGLD